MGFSVKQHSTAGFALVVCRQLYEDTDGRTMEWRQPIGDCSVQTAVAYGIEHGWLLFDARDSSICLSEEGRRLVRKTFS